MNPGERILDLLFPPKCPFCRRVLDDPRAPVCPRCQTTLPWLTGQRARRKVEFAQGCVSPLAYRGTVPDAIRRYKFSGLRNYARPFGLLTAQCVRDQLEQLPQAVTWAPLSRKRLRERGYDQARLMAGQVGEALGLEVIPALAKIRDTPPQSDLEEESARRANASGAYALLPGARVEGKSLLLVDDVVTSGATMGECCRVLLMAGAREVWCAALARAHGA